MLPRPRRLSRTVDIKRVLYGGRCFTTPYVRVCVLPSSNPHSRFACVVGKTVHASAVRRHQYQRWLREVGRQFLAEHPAAPAYDMVWVARPGMLAIKSQLALSAHLLPQLTTIFTNH